MKDLRKVLACVAGLLIAGYLVAADPPKKEARVTRIIRDVNVLPSDSPARPATLDERVRDNTGVRTGEESRSELTFADLTITRLGANTIFSFTRGGRSADLDSGSMLLRVPKDSGGGTIKNNAVTVGVTGTTVIFEGNRAGRSKLIVLEGGAGLRLVKHPSESKRVLAGQMLDVKAGATTLPDPVAVDLKQIMKTHPLITDFPPLPSQGLILAAIQNQQNSGPAGEPVYTGRPVGGQPPPFNPTGLLGPIVGGGMQLGGGSSHWSGHDRTHGTGPARTTGSSGKTGKPGGYGAQTGSVSSSRPSNVPTSRTNAAASKATKAPPTPTPVIIR
jgi:hypothetical protein